MELEENGVKVEIKKDGKEPKYNEWDVKDAVRTLVRAEEIKADAELMALVGPELNKQTKAMNNAAEVLYGKKENKDGENKN